MPADHPFLHRGLPIKISRFLPITEMVDEAWHDEGEEHRWDEDREDVGFGIGIDPDPISPCAVARIGVDVASHAGGKEDGAQKDQ